MGATCDGHVFQFKCMTRTCVTRERLTGVFNAGGKASAPRPSPAFLPPRKQGRSRRRQAGPPHCTRAEGQTPSAPGTTSCPWARFVPFAQRAEPSHPHKKTRFKPAHQQLLPRHPARSPSPPCPLRRRARSGGRPGPSPVRVGREDSNTLRHGSRRPSVPRRGHLGRARSQQGWEAPARRRVFRPGCGLVRGKRHGRRGRGDPRVRTSPPRTLPAVRASFIAAHALGVAAGGRRGGVPALGSQRDTHNQNFLSRADAASARSSGPGGDARRAPGDGAAVHRPAHRGRTECPKVERVPPGTLRGRWRSTARASRTLSAPASPTAASSLLHPHRVRLPARDPPRRPRAPGQPAPSPLPAHGNRHRPLGPQAPPAAPGSAPGAEAARGEWTRRGVDTAVSPAADREPGSPRPAAPLTRRPHGEPLDPRSGGSRRPRSAALPAPTPTPPGANKGGSRRAKFRSRVVSLGPGDDLGVTPVAPAPPRRRRFPAPRPSPPAGHAPQVTTKGRGGGPGAARRPVPPSPGSAFSSQPRHRRQQVFAASGREDDPALAPPFPCNLPAGAPRPPARRPSRAPQPEWAPAGRGPAPRGRSLPPAPPQSAALLVLRARRLRPRTESCRTSARTPHPRPLPARPPRSPPRCLPRGRSAHWRGGAACAGLGRGRRDAGRPLSAGGSAGGSAGSPPAGPAAGADSLPRAGGCGRRGRGAEGDAGEPARRAEAFPDRRRDGSETTPPPRLSPHLPWTPPPPAPARLRPPGALRSRPAVRHATRRHRHMPIGAQNCARGVWETRPAASPRGRTGKARP
ncbi:basic proline-rich protein-like [Lontra canadensis]|uniref:basic proline-rich protein-like n=1 Tax=Lontra canadensis TaxID=76717 RepID=UPI0013F3951B|nr:basic proline-rich protein-like [Lontra canadensis]